MPSEPTIRETPELPTLRWSARICAIRGAGAAGGTATGAAFRLPDGAFVGVIEIATTKPYWTQMSW